MLLCMKIKYQKLLLLCPNVMKLENITVLEWASHYLFLLSVSVIPWRWGLSNGLSKGLMCSVHW